MADRQYIAVEFRPAGKLFTYHNDGPTVFVGDRVRVPGRTDEDGWQRVTVREIVRKPVFETKGILGRVEDVPTDEQAAEMGHEQKGSLI